MWTVIERCYELQGLWKSVGVYRLRPAASSYESDVATSIGAMAYPRRISRHHSFLVHSKSPFQSLKTPVHPAFTGGLNKEATSYILHEAASFSLNQETAFATRFILNRFPANECHPVTSYDTHLPKAQTKDVLLFRVGLHPLFAVIGIRNGRINRLNHTVKGRFGNLIEFVLVCTEIIVPQVRIPDFPIKANANHIDFFLQSGVLDQRFGDADSALSVDTTLLGLRVK
jgi:hypothetical protein